MRHDMATDVSDLLYNFGCNFEIIMFRNDRIWDLYRLFRVNFNWSDIIYF